ncbi:hypothetical protein AVEN_1909-1 [Araneus ventricosus]|uniref:Uncharacterized protein n=1 Tax=Araneus ventricosus TaxID=182803 RepID=A0A4Y2J319_ARAVE|nr:hypothetical protein AVEN_1909-1 [Araneus ventricosus]
MNRGNKIDPSVLLIFNGDAHDGVHGGVRGDDDAHDDVHGGVRGDDDAHDGVHGDDGDHDGGGGHDDGDDHGGVRGDGDGHGDARDDGDDGLLDRQKTGMWRTCIIAQGRERQIKLLRVSENVKHNPSFSFIH